MFSYDGGDGKFREAWNLGLLDGTEESGNEAAAPYGCRRMKRFLYVSVRGADIVVVVSLEGRGLGRWYRGRSAEAGHPKGFGAGGGRQVSDYGKQGFKGI